MSQITWLSEEAKAYFEYRTDLLSDPFPLFRKLQEQGPVIDAGARTLVTRFDDIKAALQVVAPLSNRPEGSLVEAQFANLSESAIQKFREVRAFEALFISRADPPYQARIRTIAHRAFTPRRVAAMEATIRSIAQDLLAPLHSGQTIEFISTLAWKLPLFVVTDLMGVPPQDREQLHAWSATYGRYRSDKSFLQAAHEALGHFRDYIGELIQIQRKHPQENLISTLLEAIDAGQMTEDEVFATCTMMIYAGHETTTNLIGNGLVALLRNRDQWDVLRADPSLVSAAVEEVIRYDAPVQYLERHLTDETTVAGETVAKGRTLILMIGAGNRDPRHFNEPNRLDILRPDAKHLGFGFGPHFCLGAALARLEGAIVFGELIRRFPRTELATDQINWRKNTILRGVEELPLLIQAS